MGSLTSFVPILAATVFMLDLAAGASAAVKPKPPTAASHGPPMRFVIVRTNVPGCEPNCPQWISAEGTIVPGSPALLKKALLQSGKARLPIIITSPGGDVDSAIAMGEMIRAQKLDVAVGWTFFAGCSPGDKTCVLPKEQKGVYRGIAMTWRAYCFSACPLVLAAGQRRLAGDAYVGVHQINETITRQHVIYRERYLIVNGKKKLLSREIVRRRPVESYVTTQLEKSKQRKLAAYVDKMGIDASFLALFQTAPPSSIHLLAASEATSTKLITDPASAWTLVDNRLCKAAPPADNCVLAPASGDQKAKP